ncbi:MAG: hypothetical protein LBD16_00475 [Oscillospiraceae bacterium]|jgi:hypothetical protein|nr:hypothetical protein [Oscillospiraceae bacterium]
MKCPNCGHWNKESFPRCFKCGAELSSASACQDWKQQMQGRKTTQTVIEYDAHGQPIETKQAPSLAEEMNELKARRAQGMAVLSSAKPRYAAREREAMNGMPQRTSAAEAARLDFAVEEVDPEEETPAPMDADVIYSKRSRDLFMGGNEDELVRPRRVPKPSARSAGVNARVAKPPQKGVASVSVEASARARAGSAERPRSASTERQRAAAHQSMLRQSRNEYDYTPLIDMDIPPQESDTRAITIMPTRAMSVRGARNAAAWILRALIAIAVLAIGFVVFRKYVQPNLPAKQEETHSEYIISEATVQGLPGRTILIPGEEGDKIIIRELAHTYTVIGGYATVTVADYMLYETEGITPEEESVHVELLPSLNGNTPLAPIVLDIPIPMSKIVILQPRSVWTQVSTAVGAIQLEVQQGSRVLVGGQDVSDTMNDSGVLTVSQPVQPIGDNIIDIYVTSPHQRTNHQTVTFYRAPVEISLELREDSGTRAYVSNKKVSTPPVTEGEKKEDYFLISASTMPGATITVETPHKNLDATNLNTTGAFTFMPVFDALGDNKIIIRASYPGKADTVLEHTVYYVPTATEYSRTAWALAPTDYAELLGNISRRIGQVYQCQGEITQIISESPQIAIMNTGKNGTVQNVMLENKSGEVWVQGQSYKVFADVSGMYDTMPRMYGRYTYK